MTVRLQDVFVDGWTSTPKSHHYVFADAKNQLGTSLQKKVKERESKGDSQPYGAIDLNFSFEAAEGERKDAGASTVAVPASVDTAVQQEQEQEQELVQGRLAKQDVASRVASERGERLAQIQVSDSEEDEEDRGEQAAEAAAGVEAAAAAVAEEKEREQQAEAAAAAAAAEAEEAAPEGEAEADVEEAA